MDDFCFVSRKYKFHQPDQLYFISFAVVGWLDVFIRNEYRDILLESWKYCIRHKGLEIYGWCIMTSHVHLIIGSHMEPMSNIIRDMKKYTSGRLIRSIQENPRESRREWMLSFFRQAGEQNSQNKIYQFWQQDNHPVVLISIAVAYQKLEYIHANPVRAWFVEYASAYAYSSAKNYSGGKGIIDIRLPNSMVSRLKD
jgi:REP element-mobilizing transposase RayT